MTEYRRVQTLEEAEHRLLLEVDHRTKNVLAIVDSIVRLSKSDNAASYAASVQQRVQALSRTHMLLAEHGWQEVELADIIRAQVQIFDSGGIEIDGPAVMISAPSAQPIGLALHELAANAAVHGGLSQRKGTLRISWVQTSSGLTLTAMIESVNFARVEKYPAVLVGNDRGDHNALKLSTGKLAPASGCIFCASVHSRFASHFSNRGDDVQRLFDEGTGADLGERSNAIVDAAVALRQTPPHFGQQHILRLKAAGLSLEEISDAIHRAAFFNWQTASCSRSASRCRPRKAVVAQNVSTQGRTSISQLQAFLGWRSSAM
jgi:alkylhydroperoxidase family enzyme